MSDVLAIDFLRKVAQVANNVSIAAGVGGMELAGQIISVLYANPEHIERFMVEGGELFIDGTLDPKNGCLTYMAESGRITDPSVLRVERGQQQ